MDAATSVSNGRRWTHVLPAPVRALGRPVLHAWQYVYDTSRGIRNIRRSKKDQARERRRALDQATPILQDMYGFRFVLYPYDQPNLLVLVRHPADKAEFKVIPRLVGVGDVAFDVGANLGFYSALLSRLCGLSGRVWAFEPVPETYWRLRETLALNRCENVIPVRAAVCDRDGVAAMNLFDSKFAELNTLGMRSVTSSDGMEVFPSRSLEVPTRALDRFCEAEGLERINFLKVDVEGFEPLVFRGAEGLLREHRVDYICFEISRPPLKGAGFETRDVFAALEQHGYSAYALDKTEGTFSGPVHDTQEEWTNFFASTRDLTKL